MDECAQAVAPCGAGQTCMDLNLTKSGSFVCVCANDAQRAALGTPADCGSDYEMPKWLFTCLLIAGILVFIAILIVMKFAGTACRGVCVDIAAVRYSKDPSDSPPVAVSRNASFAPHMPGIASTTVAGRPEGSGPLSV